MFPIEIKRREIEGRLVRNRYGVSANELRRQGLEMWKDWNDFVREKDSEMRYNRMMQYGRDDLRSLPAPSGGWL